MAEPEEVERKLRRELADANIRLMEADLRLTQQRLKLAPWWLAVRCLMALAAVLWGAVFVAWAVKGGH